MQFLKVEGLQKSFGGLVAIHDLEFQVEEGEIIGLIGPNGSGKTTTLNLLTGFLKPDSGAIVLKGENVTGLPRNRMSQKGVARTFQLTNTGNLYHPHCSSLFPATRNDGWHCSSANVHPFRRKTGKGTRQGHGSVGSAGGSRTCRSAI
jgi:ABC-type oligopeptide transport system ATPase subunit